MNPHHLDDFGHSLLDLFRVETENQTAILTGALLELERSPPKPQQFQTLLRAVHSLKGAARIVNLNGAVRVAHAMEDCFAAAQAGEIQLGRSEIDLLLRGVDLLLHFASGAVGDPTALQTAYSAETQQFLGELDTLVSKVKDPQPIQRISRAKQGPPKPALQKSTPSSSAALARKHEPPERLLRLAAENLDRLLALAGEALVESRWLGPFSGSLQRLKRLHSEVSQSLVSLRNADANRAGIELGEDPLRKALEQLGECQQFLAEKLDELDLFDRRSAHLSNSLYLEVLRARMRPFGDGVRRFPRMMRDLAHALGKEVRLEIAGEHVQVDRDILERLETPLVHLLRNAVDHGCESPAERKRAGKAIEGVVRLEARHSAGMLLITVSDDGVGIDEACLRRLIVDKGLTTASAADNLGEMELLEFLFLPGITLKPTVTEISGRGMGLDIVQNMVKSVRGAVHISTQPGRGTRFQLQLPLTLSVLRTLLVGVGSEPYAIPLARITRTLKLPRDKIQALENRHYFTLGNQQIGLLMAHQVLDCEPQPPGHELPVVILSDRNTQYGLVVDRFLGERELVVQPLDPRLGKVKDISAAALMDDGAPVLILDVDDVVYSIERLIANGLLAKVASSVMQPTSRTRKRILAVDDSLAVRELVRKLLTSRGYLVDLTVDGLDAWNAVRTGHYDLVITDVDMPRMDGIELATLIKKDPNLKSLPVIIISYKDREEYRLRSHEVGVDYYLTKRSFHDETLMLAIVDLIGQPNS